MKLHEIFAWGDSGGPWGGAPKNKPRVVGGGRTQQAQGGGLSDLEDVLNQFKQRFGGFGSGGSAGGWPVAPQWIVVGLLVVWLLSGLYIVAPEQAGVVTRFGAYVRTTEPGLHYHLPWPAERVQKPMVTRENVLEVGFRSEGARTFYATAGQVDVPEESMMLTGDENIVDLDFTVRWKIGAPAAYLFNVVDPEATLAASAESVMREVIGRHPIDDALTDDKVQIQNEARADLQKVLDSYQSGVVVTGVELQRVNPPNEVIEAFRDVQAARADAEKAINEATGHANQIVPQARGQAEQVLAEARAYREATVAKAEGEASRFEAQLGAYRANPEVTRDRLYYEASQEILKNVPKVVVTGKSSSGVLPYLPLQQLMPASGNQTGGRQ